MILKIESPCSQDWNKMQASEQGKFCQNCKKSVIDFKYSSDAAIAKEIKAAKGEICGRLNLDKINRANVAEPYVPHWSTRWLMACSVFIGFSSTLPALPYFFSNSKAILQTENRPLQNAGNLHDQKIDFGIRILDSLTKEPIAFAVVIINELSLYGQTDINGEIHFKIPKFYEGDEISVKIKSIGYHQLIKGFQFNTIKDEAIVEVYMNGGSEIDLGLVGAISYNYEKPSLWQRVKYFFTRRHRE